MKFFTFLLVSMLSLTSFAGEKFELTQMLCDGETIDDPLEDINGEVKKTLVTLDFVSETKANFRMMVTTMIKGTDFDIDLIIPLTITATPSKKQSHLIKDGALFCEVTGKGEVHDCSKDTDSDIFDETFTMEREVKTLKLIFTDYTNYVKTCKEMVMIFELI